MRFYLSEGRLVCVYVYVQRDPMDNLPAAQKQQLEENLATRQELVQQHSMVKQLHHVFATVEEVVGECHNLPYGSMGRLGSGTGVLAGAMDQQLALLAGEEGAAAAAHNHEVRALVEYTRVLEHKRHMVRTLRELNDTADAMRGVYSEAFRDRYAAVLVDLRQASFHVNRCRQELADVQAANAHSGMGIDASFSRTVMDAAIAVWLSPALHLSVLSPLTLSTKRQHACRMHERVCREKVSIWLSGSLTGRAACLPGGSPGDDADARGERHGERRA